MILDCHYTDSRLVELYDLANPSGIDHDFYVQLAVDNKAQSIVDLGCGTGLLTRALPGCGCEVTGIDPAAAMLDFASKQPGADKVQWILGDSDCIGQSLADLVLMTGNVAQVFLSESEWLTTLGNCFDALRPGGVISFESRNPDAKEWLKWTRDNTRCCLDSNNGQVQSWLELVSVQRDRVQFINRFAFLATGEHLIVDSTLCFRTQHQIHRSLQQTGFQIDKVYGGWSGEALTSKSRLMVFVARKGACKKSN